MYYMDEEEEWKRDSWEWYEESWCEWKGFGELDTNFGWHEIKKEVKVKLISTLF